MWDAQKFHFPHKVLQFLDLCYLVSVYGAIATVCILQNYMKHLDFHISFSQHCTTIIL